MAAQEPNRSGNHFKPSGSGLSNRASGRGRSSPTFAYAPGRDRSPIGGKASSSYSPHPLPSRDSPSPRPGGLQRGDGLWDTPHEKDVPPTHPEMATRGCTTPYREGSPSTRGPPTTQGEVTGACPIPPAPKAPSRGESRDRKTGVRREPIFPLPPIPSQESTKPGPKPKQMPRYQGRGFGEQRYTAPPERLLTSRRDRSKPSPKGTSRSRGRGQGAF